MQSVVPGMGDEEISWGSSPSEATDPYFSSLLGPNERLWGVLMVVNLLFSLCKCRSQM